MTAIILLRNSPRRHGFSITELLVVIGIIVLLMGLLLVALGNVRDSAKRTATESTMNGFAAACDAFQLEHGFYPGIVPEQILAEDPKISGTENAILHLMGGAVREDDLGADYAGYDNNGEDQAADWVEIAFNHAGGTYRIKVNTRRIGDGPLVNGTPYQPYFTPKETEFGRVIGEQINEDEDMMLPEIIDAWGQPIIYLRQLRPRGPLVGGLADKPQFLLGPITPYSQSTDLGEQGRDQIAMSVLNVGADVEQQTTLAMVLEHGALAGTPRGAYMLLSPGPDGVYMSIADGPGTPAAPIDNGGPTITDFHMLGPRIIEEFDDVRVFGGG